MVTEILNYSIIRRIGGGSMGQVFLAKNKSIHQFVAIKMLNPKYSGNPFLRERFRQEAIMLSALNHPNIVKFLNYVENENGIFLIMEYVDGLTLDDYLTKKTGLLVEKNAFPMMLEILDAFEYAHDHNVIHRDIKPGNILVTREGKIKILDFGIAQILSETNADNNATYEGTIAYMSPEQVRGHKLDTRSDIYSLGVVFHQMLTGRPPYDASRMTHLDIKKAISSEPLCKIREVYPYVSDSTQHLIDKATAKSPEERYSSCKEMAGEIRHIQRESVKRDSGDGKKGGSKSWIVILAALLVLIGAGVLLFIFLGKDGSRHYADYAEKWAVAEGIGGAMSPQDSTLSFHVEYQGGKPVRVTLESNDGVKAVYADSIFALYKPVDVKYFYKEDGKPDAKKVYDSNGKLLYTVKFTEDIENPTIAMGEDAKDLKYRFVYNNDNGLLQTVYYVDADGKNEARKGVYGEKYTYDAKGAIKRVAFIDENQNVVENEEGIAIIDFEYNGKLAETKSSLYDRHGKPASPKAAGTKEPQALGGKKSKKGSHSKDGSASRAPSARPMDRSPETSKVGPRHHKDNSGSEYYDQRDPKKRVQGGYLEDKK